MPPTILIIDFGSQFTQLIARRLREGGVFSQILPYSATPQMIRASKPHGIILSGGPNSVTAQNPPKIPQIVFDLSVPILGICYGQQALCQQLGGIVRPSKTREFGRASVQIHAPSPLFDGIWQAGESYPVWMSHGDSAAQLPDGFAVIAASPAAPLAIIADEKRKYYGVQFHPEVAHTPDGIALLNRFAKGICGVTSVWSMADYRRQAIAKIRQQVGAGRVICGLSGGVDSSVTAVLLHEAIGEQLTCVFVDHGLMRTGEAAEVIRLFGGHYNIPLIVEEASDLFLGRLAGITDPEQKRKIIGTAFIDVFDKAAATVEGVKFLAQGTLYPDVIESISATGGPSATIKSHHNVGGLPEKMALQLVEPLRDLFKDEVRALGRAMGMPESLIGRHPFPGPGLGIRILGEVNKAKCNILRAADRIYLEEIRKANLYDDIWQAFAVLLPVQTVGVMGDARTYEFVCALRAVAATDGMTAECYPFSHEFLAHCATRIVNEVEGINRVVYDYTAKPPGTIEWE